MSVYLYLAFRSKSKHYFFPVKHDVLKDHLAREVIWEWGLEPFLVVRPLKYNFFATFKSNIFKIITLIPTLQHLWAQNSLFEQEWRHALVVEEDFVFLEPATWVSLQDGAVVKLIT